VVFERVQGKIFIPDVHGHAVVLPLQEIEQVLVLFVLEVLCFGLYPDAAAEWRVFVVQKVGGRGECSIYGFLVDQRGLLIIDLYRLRRIPHLTNPPRITSPLIPLTLPIPRPLQIRLPALPIQIRPPPLIFFAFPGFLPTRAIFTISATF